MRSCLVCSTEFEPTNARHRYCGNTCVQRICIRRKAIRSKVHQIVKTLRTIESLELVDSSLEEMLENIANEK